MTFRNIALVALIVVFGALPWWSDASVQNIVTKVLVAGLFAMSFNLVWGQAGLLFFGQAAYFGIGTFAAVFGMGISGGAPLFRSRSSARGRTGRASDRNRGWLVRNYALGNLLRDDHLRVRRTALCHRISVGCSLWRRSGGPRATE